MSKTKSKLENFCTLLLIIDMGFLFPSVRSCENRVIGINRRENDEKIPFAFCSKFSVNGNLFLRVTLVDSS